MGILDELMKRPAPQPSGGGLLGAMLGSSQPPQTILGPPFKVRSDQYAQMAPYRVDVPPDVFKNKDWDAYENLVNQFIQKNRLSPNDTFFIEHPADDPNQPGRQFYRYLGPNSGGRQDWMLVDPAPPSHTS